MADITMCLGDGCDLKFKCHRFTANQSGWQSYFSEFPMKNGKCDMFLSNESEQIYVDLWDIVKGNLKDK